MQFQVTFIFYVSTELYSLYAGIIYIYWLVKKPSLFFFFKVFI